MLVRSVIFRFAFAIAAVLGSGSIAVAMPPEVWFFSPGSKQTPHHTANEIASMQYLTLYSRISVYAVYCDPQNHQGLNTLASGFRQRTTGLWAQAERALGGVQSVYGIFEGLRNDDSLRMIRNNTDATCASGGREFRFMAGLSQADAANQAAHISVR